MRPPSSRLTIPPQSCATCSGQSRRGLGRVRTENRDAPRPIDLDVLLYEGFSGEVAGSSIPDPDIATRPYLAVPAADVAPDWEYPAPGKT